MTISEPFSWCGECGCDVSQGGVFFARCPGKTPEQASERAAFIVRATARHAELVEALEAIKARVNGEWDTPALMAFGPLSDTAADCAEIARQALSRAQEGGDRL